MNYYKRHLGDYARKTAHLSLLEHGVYTVLLDAYYDRERPLSEQEAIRFSRARTPEEIAAVKTILSECFCEQDGLFSQSHADEVIAEFHKRQKINRKLGAIGGKRNAKRIESESLVNVEANDKPSHKPLATIHKEKKERDADLLIGLPDQLVKDFLRIRKEKRLPLTKTAIDAIERDARKAGYTLEQALTICCEKTWASFKPEWLGAKPAANDGSPASMRALT